MELIILFWAILCPNPNNNHENQDKHNTIEVTSDYSGDTGGETGNLPPKPPIPPPPPPFGI